MAGLLSLADAQAAVLARVRPLEPEEVAVVDAAHRIKAEMTANAESARHYR